MIQVFPTTDSDSVVFPHVVHAKTAIASQRYSTTVFISINARSKRSTDSVLDPYHVHYQPLVSVRGQSFPPPPYRNALRSSGTLLPLPALYLLLVPAKSLGFGNCSSPWNFHLPS